MGCAFQTHALLRGSPLREGIAALSLGRGAPSLQSDTHGEEAGLCWRCRPRNGVQSVCLMERQATAEVSLAISLGICNPKGIQHNPERTAFEGKSPLAGQDFHRAFSAGQEGPDRPLRVSLLSGGPITPSSARAGKQRPSPLFAPGRVSPSEEEKQSARRPLYPSSCEGRQKVPLGPIACREQTGSFPEVGMLHSAAQVP